MPQISFPLDKAHQALDEFLTGEDAVDHLDNRYSRSIYDEKDNRTAVILSDKEYRDLLQGYNAWQDSQEPKDSPDLPPGYRPYVHSPEARVDRYRTEKGTVLQQAVRTEVKKAFETEIADAVKQARDLVTKELGAELTEKVTATVTAALAAK